MFETYQFTGVYIAIQAVLTLYAQGKKDKQPLFTLNTLITIKLTVISDVIY